MSDYKRPRSPRYTFTFSEAEMLLLVAGLTHINSEAAQTLINKLDRKREESQKRLSPTR